MNLLRTLAAVSGMTLLSRITGLIREFLFARYFGVSAYTDAFFIAFRIPNLLRRLFAEGAFSQAFVPILAEYKTTHGVVEAKRLIDHVWTVLAWFLLLLSVLGVLGAAYVVYAMAAGLSSNAGAFSAAVLMTRVMFPYILCMSLVAFASGVLNTWGHFRITAFTPVLLNVSLIVAMLFFCRYLAQPIYGLAFAVLFGGFLQLGLQLWALRRIFLLPRLSFNVRAAWKDPGVKRVIKQMLPATFAVSVAQLSLMINTLIASYLPHGSVSWLSYADRLMEFPTALLGVALGTILLPSLSKAYSDADHSEYSQLLDWGLRLTFLLALPAALMMIILALPMTAVLFHYGQFTAHDALMTQHALIAYGIGLIGLILVKILAPGFMRNKILKHRLRLRSVC